MVYMELVVIVYLVHDVVLILDNYVEHDGQLFVFLYRQYKNDFLKEKEKKNEKKNKSNVCR